MWIRFWPAIAVSKTRPWEGRILWGFACLVLASLLQRAESFFGNPSFHICGLHCGFCSIGISQTVQVLRVR
jgi:hypothetical protein